MFSQSKRLEGMWTTNNLKSKIIYTIHYFDKGHLKAANNTNFDTKIEKYSCWSILFIDKLKIEAKIIHKGRGKFKILEDKYKGKYVNKIVDASDVIRCIVNSDDDKTYNIASKEKLAQFSNKKQYIDLET